MAWKRLADQPGKRVVNKQYKDIIYWEIRDGFVWHQKRKQRSADPASFEFRDDNHNFIGRDKNWIFHAWDKMKNIDRDSFEVLTDNYCRDKDLAYCEYETSLKPVKGTDVATFAILGNGYARDSEYGYYWGRPLRKCTAPMTLQTVKSIKKTADCYARDENHIYFEGAVLKGADLET